MDTTSAANFSALDLLDLPPAEREIFLHVARNGPADVAALAGAVSRPAQNVREALDNLFRKGRMRRLPDGRAEVALGRVASRTTLPAQMWPALLAPQRLFSEQEIVTLNTAIPMLQFARARMSEFADHGPSHALRVKAFATQLGFVTGLSEAERRLLRAAALFHDIGNVVERERHHLISQETVERLAAAGRLPFTPKEAELIGLVCRWHRGEYEPGRADELRGEAVRTGLVASILRVADAMDIDSRRSDYDQRFRQVLEFFFADRLPYWTSLEEILGVRIHCCPQVTLQVFTRRADADNPQIAMLRRDIAATPLGWTVQEIAVPGEQGAGPARPRADRALLAFPFDPHSLIMTAISRKRLRAAGWEADLLCYPDTVDGQAWLWREALAEVDPAGYGQLIAIGDRPGRQSNAAMFDVIRRWRAGAGAAVTVLNRHEANWALLPQLLALGVEVTLGGDWAYFWGENPDLQDLRWGRIAALVARDHTLAAANLSAQEQAVVQGLLKVVFDVLALKPAGDTAGWLSLAQLILERIAADDQDYFAGQAPAFAQLYAAADAPGRVQGRAVVFEQAPGRTPQSYYWILEAAIERYGRAVERGTRFSVPYAVAAWPAGEEVELLAISHWREDEATPVRLLYPGDIGPPPIGTESTIHAHLPAEVAPIVLQRLLEACNR